MCTVQHKDAFNFLAIFRLRFAPAAPLPRPARRRPGLRSSPPQHPVRRLAAAATISATPRRRPSPPLQKLATRGVACVAAARRFSSSRQLLPLNLLLTWVPHPLPVLQRVGLLTFTFATVATASLPVRFHARRATYQRDSPRHDTYTVLDPTSAPHHSPRPAVVRPENRTRHRTPRDPHVRRPNRRSARPIATRLLGRAKPRPKLVRYDFAFGDLPLAHAVQPRSKSLRHQTPQRFSRSAVASRRRRETTAGHPRPPQATRSLERPRFSPRTPPLRLAAAASPAPLRLAGAYALPPMVLTLPL